MSLFKSREWWSTQCGTDEVFDNLSLLVTKLNSHHDYVIVGSHSGVLRIFQPGADKLDDGHLIGYRATDLIIEIQLANPVLQICAGRLVSGSQILQLAILHPKSVGVYSLVTKSGVTEHGTQNNVLLVYEHALKRSAASLVVGPFGGSQHRDFMCIQSLDGMLAFFEQEIFSFCCFLPNFLIPSTLVFVKSSDSFVTLNSNWEITSFKYKNLSEHGQNSNLSDTVGTKIDPNWAYNLGEYILDMSVIENETNETFIVILGERNMFCLSESGKLKFMKKFDFAPQCFHPYYISKIFVLSGSTSRLMTLVITETNTLLVYDNVTLKWSAQLSFLPTAINRGFFGCVSGSLVLLSDSGLLQFAYLGTEPQLFAAPPLQNQEMDFEEAERELNMLNKVIKSHKNNDIELSNAVSERDLIITITVNPHLEASTYQNEITTDDENSQIPMCLVSVELLPNSPFEEVQISLTVDQALEAQPQIHFVNNLEDKVIFDSYVYLRKSFEIVSLEMKVIISHITTTGMPRILMRSVQLPLKLVCFADVPSKDALHKITLNINDQAAPLSVLFPEFAGEQSFSMSSSAVGFKQISGAGATVTILLAKSSQRYRLQSDSLASLNLFVEQLNLRLKKHFEKKSDFKISHGSPLPIAPFLEIIEKHFEKRDSVTDLQNQLCELSAQFRLIQKRLIAKFKHKNPTALNNLDILMYETYKEITECSDKLQNEKLMLLKVQSELSCVIRLIMNLTKCSEVPLENYNIVNAMFVTPIVDIEGQGWEDMVEISISHLLRTVLAKSEKDRLKNISNSLEQVKDINKFKKRVAQILDRLVKITTAISDNSQQVTKDEETEVTINPKQEVSQVGSKIAVSSARAQSARMRKKLSLSSTPEENEDDNKI